MMDRRDFLARGLGGLGALSLAAGADAASLFDPLAGLEPIRATPDRIFRITVCLRPFRAPGRASRSKRWGASGSSIIMAMAAAAGHCPGDRPRLRSAWRWRRG